MTPLTTARRWEARRVPTLDTSAMSTRLLSPSPPSPPVDSSVVSKPKLLDQVRHVLRFRHYSYRTEQTYVH